MSAPARVPTLLFGPAGSRRAGPCEPRAAADLGPCFERLSIGLPIDDGTSDGEVELESDEEGFPIPFKLAPSVPQADLEMARRVMLESGLRCQEELPRVNERAAKLQETLRDVKEKLAAKKLAHRKLKRELETKYNNYVLAYDSYAREAERIRAEMDREQNKLRDELRPLVEQPGLQLDDDRRAKLVRAFAAFDERHAESRQRLDALVEDLRMKLALYEEFSKQELDLSATDAASDSASEGLGGPGDAGAAGGPKRQRAGPDAPQRAPRGGPFAEAFRGAYQERKRNRAWARELHKSGT